MQFFDRAKIYVRAGNGGNGSAHFRREKYVPRGGPDGGDGGRGGSVYLEADAALNTLVDFHYHPHHKAGSGGAGGGQQMHGAKGEDLILKVPSGTIVRDAETDELVADLVEPGQVVMVARGGRGGLGNVHFKSPTNQAPREAQLGEPGQEITLALELKLIADVGLVGFPNAGKSTLLSVVSAARPKIADYPFTTLVPNLGVVEVGDISRGNGVSFVMADIPGLIEGAAQGVGLGHEFLRHVERTKLLLHLVDGGATEREPWDEFEAINRELYEYGEHLATRPQIVVFTKMDLPDAQERWPALKQRAEEAGLPVVAISAATREGVDELMGFAVQRLQEIRVEQAEQAAADAARGAIGPVLRPEPEDAYTVERTREGFLVRGKRVERMVAMTNPASEEGMARLEQQLRRMGVTQALEQAGVQPGDTVAFGRTSLEWGEAM
jgi:GTP-binding protein